MRSGVIRRVVVVVKCHERKSAAKVKSGVSRDNHVRRRWSRMHTFREERQNGTSCVLSLIARELRGVASWKSMYTCTLMCRSTVPSFSTIGLGVWDSKAFKVVKSQSNINTEIKASPFISTRFKRKGVHCTVYYIWERQSNKERRVLTSEQYPSEICGDSPPITHPHFFFQIPSCIWVGIKSHDGSVKYWW